MNWRLPDVASWTALRKWAVEKVRQVLKECQQEWRSRPLIRHLSALALCLFVVLVGVLETSTKRASRDDDVGFGSQRCETTGAVAPRGLADADAR